MRCDREPFKLDFLTGLFQRKSKAIVIIVVVVTIVLFYHVMVLIDYNSLPVSDSIYK